MKTDFNKAVIDSMNKPNLYKWQTDAAAKLIDKLDAELQTKPRPLDKRYYYKTAQALISCAKFNKGDFVTILSYDGQGTNGTHWFLVSKTGKGCDAVAYPEHHLTSFVL